jgi:hypothetical protein
VSARTVRGGSAGDRQEDRVCHGGRGHERCAEDREHVAAGVRCVRQDVQCTPLVGHVALMIGGALRVVPVMTCVVKMHFALRGMRRLVGLRCGRHERSQCHGRSYQRAERVTHSTGEAQDRMAAGRMHALPA